MLSEILMTKLKALKLNKSVHIEARLIINSSSKPKIQARAKEQTKQSSRRY